MYLSSRGSGYPILFIHGMLTSSWLWSGIIDRLRDLLYVPCARLAWSWQNSAHSLRSETIGITC